MNDRISRKRVMILADLARAVIVLLMLAVRSREWVGLIYVLLFVETTMWAFFEPARNAVIPNITRGSELLTANTLSATTWSVIMAAGFPWGEWWRSWPGRSTVFVVNAVSFLVSASLVRAMRFDEPHVAAARPLRARDLTDFTPLVEGLRYVASDRRLLALLLVKAGLGVMGANLVILPVLGERTFPVSWGGLDPHRAGMLGMSILTGARGLGALLGPLIGGRWAAGTESRLRSGILYGFLAGAAGYLALGFSTPCCWRWRWLCWRTPGAPSSGSFRRPYCRIRRKTASADGSSPPIMRSTWSPCPWSVIWPACLSTTESGPNQSPC